MASRAKFHPHPDGDDEWHFCCFCGTTQPAKGVYLSYVWGEVMETAVPGQPWGCHKYSTRPSHGTGIVLAGPLCQKAMAHWCTPDTVPAAVKGVQWSRLWSCKACILVRQREAKRTATAEMPPQGQGEPSSGQAAAAVVQPQACPAFQQLVQHLSQDRSASQALTRATQSQSQGQPSQHSNPLSQVGQSPFRLRSEKAWYVEQVATLSSRLHDLGVAGKQAAEDSEKALLEARGAARHLAVGLSELAGMLSRAGVAPSAPTSDAERTNMLKRVHTAVQRLQTREQEGAEAKATLGDVLAAFRASGFSHLSTAAGAEDLVVKKLAVT